MSFSILKMKGIGEYRVEETQGRKKYWVGEKVFLVENEKTLEVRTDRNLAEKLEAEYESVMRSRYFGKGGIEIIESGQLSLEEIEDLVRLSYNLSKD